MRNNTYKILFIFVILLILIIFPFSNSDKNDFKVPMPVDDLSVGYYQSTTCSISLWEVMTLNYSSQQDLYFNNNTYPGTECFGKVTGLDKVKEKYIVSIGTNTSINLLVQSFIWLLLIIFIKPGKNQEKGSLSILKITFISLILSSIFTFQHLSESRFYGRTNIYHSDEITTNNLYLVGIFLIYYLIFLLINEVISSREKVIINYLPFVFLVSGTFNGANLNIYLLILSYFGLKSLFYYMRNKYLNIFYLIFTIIWISSNNPTMNFFDTDKLRGFINSSNNQSSLYFWIIVLFLVANGFYYLLNISEINLTFVKKSFLYSGASIVFFGILGAISPFFNFFNYFVFGQNKRGMTNLTSIAGNTWRGFSPSAESIGEFYAAIILFLFIYKIKGKINIKLIDYFLLSVVAYGLYKTNNFAAVSSLILISVVFILNEKIKNRNIRIRAFSFLGLAGMVMFFLFITNLNYEYLSSELLFETSQHFNFFGNSDNYKNFLSIERYFDQKNIGTMLEVSDNKVKASSSYLFLVNVFTPTFNTPLIPNIVALISTVSLLINRTEMWGIFFAKYSPSATDAIFGSGPLQISDYLYKHEIRLDLPSNKLESLFLPHSSVFDLIIFYGILGFFIFSILVCKLLISKNYKKIEGKYLLVFMLINILKSDSLLYITSSMLLFFMVALITNVKNENVNN